MRFAALAILLCCLACGGDSYRWYCDELSTTPSTWRLVPRYCGGPTLVLRLDRRDPQPCGDGACTCTLSAWRFHREKFDSGFGHYMDEACQATAVCTFPAGPVNLDLKTRGSAITGVAHGGNQDGCSYQGTPEPP